MPTPDSRPRIDGELIKQVKKKNPEVQGLKNSQLIEWALRKQLIKKEA